MLDPKSAARESLAGLRARGHIGAMLHIAKLAVGIRDIAHLAQVQADRLGRLGKLLHQTRNFPRRAPELLDGGSIYWVVSGSMLVRQRLLDITEDHWDDGSACCSLHLDPTLVPLEGRPTRPFQGWRYLEPAAAPADLDVSATPDLTDMPESMRRELRSLGLL